MKCVNPVLFNLIGRGKRGRRRTAVMFLCAALVSGAAACVDSPPKLPDPPPTPRNLIIVSFDTCRAENFGAYGYHRDTTPNIDAFAAKSVLFERAYAQAASTAPSLSTLMTSKYPHQHGVLQTYYFALADEERTLAERMAEAGFRTAAHTGIGVLMPTRKLDQGFHDYRFTRYTNKQYWQTSADLTAQVSDWLDQNHEEPFFLWTHYFEPHQPYDIVPEEYQKKFVDEPSEHPLVVGPHRKPQLKSVFKGRFDAYDGSLAYADFQFGRLLAKLEELGLLENTMIVLTSDHGETLGEHGQHGHVFGLWEPVIRVPLIVYMPGLAPGRSAERVELVDVLPTAARVFSFDAEDTYGRLLPLYPGFLGPEEEPSGERSTYAETWFAETRVSMVRRGQWKLIATKRTDGTQKAALYNLVSDGQELKDVAAQHPKTVEQLRADLEAWTSDNFVEPVLIKERPGELDMLRALGYLQ